MLSVAISGSITYLIPALVPVDGHCAGCSVRQVPVSTKKSSPLSAVPWEGREKKGIKLQSSPSELRTDARRRGTRHQVSKHCISSLRKS